MSSHMHRQDKASSINLMSGVLPVCRSTTKWQVVASSDPITETLSVKDRKRKHVLSSWSRTLNLENYLGVSYSNCKTSDQTVKLDLLAQKHALWQLPALMWGCAGGGIATSVFSMMDISMMDYLISVQMADTHCPKCFSLQPIKIMGPEIFYIYFISILSRFAV